MQQIAHLRATQSDRGRASGRSRGVPSWAWGMSGHRVNGPSYGVASGVRRVVAVPATKHLPTAWVVGIRASSLNSSRTAVRMHGGTRLPRRSGGVLPRVHDRRETLVTVLTAVPRLRLRGRRLGEGGAEGRGAEGRTWAWDGGRSVEDGGRRRAVPRRAVVPSEFMLKHRERDNSSADSLEHGRRRPGGVCQRDRTCSVSS